MATIHWRRYSSGLHQLTVVLLLSPVTVAAFSSASAFVRNTHGHYPILNTRRKGPHLGITGIKNRHHARHFSSSQRYLVKILPDSSFVAASGVLIGSSLAGCWAERRFPNTGTIATISLAALISNLSLVPPQHSLYDLCWTTFLPASLVFLLLSNQSPTKDNDNVTDTANITSTTSSSTNQEVIKAVSIPFAMACLGSIVGCVLSFMVCRMFPRLWLVPHEAAIAASCLCASFIGGTVNFFGVAKLIGDGNISTLMSSMATADTLVMALYFSAMALALKSRFLRSAFGTTLDQVEMGEHGHREEDNEVNSPNKQSSSNLLASLGNLKAEQCMAVLVSITLALSIVSISSRFESLVAPIVPGAGCAAIAVIASAVQSVLTRQQNSFTRQMQSMSRYLSEFCLQLLFASIGTSCQIGRVLRQGPACLFFSLLALSVHIAIAFTGALLTKRWFQWPLLLEDVLIASNAAVGGPATAAAFAGRVKSPRQRGLTMAATVWGVTGYAVGTTVGVTLYKVLQQIAS